MPKVTGLGHVGVYVKDLDLMTEFYSGFLGMTQTDRSDELVFLSARPEQEHHEVLLARNAERSTDAQQISFTVETLADLKQFHAQIIERGYEIDHIFNHGNAFGCYFYDPEHNQVEVYWHTGLAWPQPCAEPLDLGLPEEDLVGVLTTMQASVGAGTSAASEAD